MRQRTRLALPFVFLTSGCLVASHDGFRTPQDTVLTFQSAFARDDEFKEYDCFARELKEEQQLTQQKWSLARAIVFEPFGWLGRLVLRRNSLEDHLVTASADERVARLDYRMFGHELTVDLAPELVLVFLGAGDEELASTAPRVESVTTTAWTFVGEVDSEAVARLRDLVAVELRREWKVREILPADQTQPPLPRAAPAAPGRAKSVDAMPTTTVQASGGGLGVTRLRVRVANGAALAGATTGRELAWRLDAPLRWAVGDARAAATSGRTCAGSRASPSSRAVFSTTKQ